MGVQHLVGQHQRVVLAAVRRGRNAPEQHDAETGISLNPSTQPLDDQHPTE